MPKKKGEWIYMRNCSINLIFASLFFLCSVIFAAPLRIVSLSPSITEIVFALGLGNSVVGVTRFCTYPPAAQSITKIGGYYDPNTELVLSLNPDMIIMAPEHSSAKTAFEKLKQNTLTVGQDNVASVLGSIEAIGKACGAGDSAAALVAGLKKRMALIQDKTRNLPRPRVLVVIGREGGAGRIRSVYVSGKNTFHSELVALARGESLYGNERIRYPQVSVESVLRLNPEVIFELAPGTHRQQADAAKMALDWNALGNIDAVKNGKVYVLVDDYVLLPGPRFILLLEKMAAAMHPEAQWN